MFSMEWVGKRLIEVKSNHQNLINWNYYGY
jgi:hypothetical protein